MTDVEKLMSQGWELSYDEKLQPELHKPAPLPNCPAAYLQIYQPDFSAQDHMQYHSAGLWRAVIRDRATGRCERYLLTVEDSSDVIKLARYAEQAYMLELQPGEL